MSTPPSVTPDVVLLHFFGSSLHEWQQVRPLLAGTGQVHSLDLPGFGDAAAQGAVDVAGMAKALAAFIDTEVQRPFVLVGHSMSGKVAMAYAATAQRRPAALLLVAPSPPSPEPMAAAVRDTLLAFDGSEPAAAAYIDSVVARPLALAVRAQAIADAQRASREAWRAWITSGSQEDWRQRVGVLELPCRIVVGDADASLGESVQRQTSLLHFAGGALSVIGGGHALPLDNPQGLADVINEFLHQVPVVAL